MVYQPDILKPTSQANPLAVHVFSSRQWRRGTVAWGFNTFAWPEELWYPQSLALRNMGIGMGQN